MTLPIFLSLERIPQALRHASADLGARVRTVNLTDLEAISALSLWDRLDRLYLLSPDPTENLQRFKAIDEQVDRSKGGRARIPLTVRIDDPWQADRDYRLTVLTMQHP